jgi:hypothetical protein
MRGIYIIIAMLYITSVRGARTGRLAAVLEEDASTAISPP